MPRERHIPPARELKSDAGDSTRPIAELLREIAGEVRLLDVSRLTPDAYHERKDMLVKRILRVAGRVDPQRARAEPTTVYRPLLPAPAAAKARTVRDLAVFKGRI